MTAENSHVKLKSILKLVAGLFVLGGCSQDLQEPSQYSEKSLDGIAVPQQVTSHIENMPDGQMLAYVSVDGDERQQMTISEDGNRASLVINNLSSGEHELEVTFEYRLANQTNTIELATTTFPVLLKEGPNKPAISNIDYKFMDNDDDNISNIDELVRGSDPNEKNRPPIVEIPMELFLKENTTETIAVSSTDPDNDELSFGLVGGDDQSMFSLSSTGELSFNSTPNYENPSDSDTNNVYLLTVEASDGYLHAQKTISITVTNVIELTAPVVTATGDLKQIKFNWSTSDDADYYQLSENPDGKSGYTVIASNINGVNYTKTAPVHYIDWINALYIVEACNIESAKCTSSSVIGIDNIMLETIGYIKASNTGAGDHFGYALALSGDGKTLAVGAYFEDSAATGIKDSNNQVDDCISSSPSNCMKSSGAVYVFSLNGANWVQQSYIKPSNTGEGDRFGYSLSLSDDGSTLAVGANLEDSAAKGIEGNQVDDCGQTIPANCAKDSGAVYVFKRIAANTWEQKAYIKASNTGTNDKFGSSVALAGDGNTLAVGADFEDSATTTIDDIVNSNDDCDVVSPTNCAADSGAAYVFIPSGTTWQQQAYVKASNTGSGDRFGYAVSLGIDGNTLAVGSVWENSAATDVNDTANEKDDCGAASPTNCAIDSGAVFVFYRSGTTWQKQAYVKASNTGTKDRFGYSVALSGDSNTLAVGAITEDSAANGINGNQVDDCAEKSRTNCAFASGAAYVFSRSGSLWQRQAYIKASNSGPEDRFGYSVSLSRYGNTLAVGAATENSASTGVNGNSNDCEAMKPVNCAKASGAAYVFNRSDATWRQQSYVKASNTEAGEYFGNSIAINHVGDTLAVGAKTEDSASMGINQNQLDDCDATEPGNCANNSGAVYLY